MLPKLKYRRRLKEGASTLKDIYYKLSPDAQYDRSKDKIMSLQNLCDYRKFINNKKTLTMKKENEDCGCGQVSNESSINLRPSISNDPNYGKFATLADGRVGKIDDSIRNSTGDVIGYVLSGDRGTFRVFKDKVVSFNESDGGMSSLSATPGMGNPALPTPDGGLGSGDQFPTLTAGTPAANGKSKKSEKRKSNLLDWDKFSSIMKKSQL